MKRQCLISLIIACSAFAKPTGMSVASGSASSETAGSLHLVTATDRAILNWDTFSINACETTRFALPSNKSSVLNRVTGGVPSDIFGSLESNGSVFLLNPRGVFIGKDATISTESFIAATFDLMDSDFLEGAELRFFGDSSGALTNLGRIQAVDGDIVLLGRTVHNSGTLDAPRGGAYLGAGAEIIYRPGDGILISAGEVSEGGIVNDGQIHAAKTVLETYQLAINSSGLIESYDFEERAGEVYLIATNARVEETGTICAPGGTVHLLGSEVGLLGTGAIDVSSPAGGGTVLLGGDYQGKGDVPTARATWVEAGTQIHADATESGNGGKVILWGNEATFFAGNITARGGATSGDGGFVEVSSPGSLMFQGLVGTEAPMGITGMLLLDPSTITIMTNGGVNVNTTGCAAYTSTGAAVTIDVGLLNTCLAGSSVTIDANAGAFGGAGSILVNNTVTGANALTWASASSLNLISSAPSSITINGSILSTGSGPITITGGAVTVAATTVNAEVKTATGLLTITGSSLDVNGAMDLLAEISTTSTGSISINTVGGNINLNGGSTAAAINAYSKISTFSSGSITIDCQDLSLAGGSAGFAASNTSAVISTGTTGSINITCNNALGIVAGMTSANNTDARASIMSNFGTGTGNITIDCVDVVLVANLATAALSDATASILTSGNVDITTSTSTISGGAVSAANGNAAAEIAVGGAGTITFTADFLDMFGGSTSMANPADADASISTSGTGGITFTGAVALNMSGGLTNFVGTSAPAQIFTSGSGNIDITVPLITLQGGTAMVGGGAGGEAGAIIYTTGTGNITATASTSINLTGGSALGANTSADGSFEARGSGNIDITTPTLDMLGGTANATPVSAEADILNTGGTITIITTNLTMQGGLTAMASGSALNRATIGNSGDIDILPTVAGAGTIDITTFVSTSSGLSDARIGNLVNTTYDIVNLGQPARRWGSVTLTSGNGMGAVGATRGRIDHTRGDVNIYSAGDITMTAGIGTDRCAAAIQVTPGPGTITVDTSADLIMTGGTGVGATPGTTTCQALIQADGNPGGAGVVITGRCANLTMTGANGGGTGTDGAAIIRANPGSIDWIATGNMTLQAGSNTGGAPNQEMAWIETAGGDGNITIQCDGDLAVLGGVGTIAGDLSSAHIAAVTGSGFVTIDLQPTSTLSIRGGTGDGDARALIYTTIGAVNIGTTTAPGTIDVLAGNSTDTTSGSIASISATSGAATIETAGTLSVLAYPIATPGSGVDYASIETFGAAANLSITCAALDLTGGVSSGVGGQSAAALVRVNGSGILSIDSSGGAITANGGSGPGSAEALIYNASGAINIGSAGSPSSAITLQGGTSADTVTGAPAQIEAGNGSITTYSTGAFSVLGGPGDGVNSAEVRTNSAGNNISIHAGAVTVTAGATPLAGATSNALISVDTSGTLLLDTTGAVAVTGGSGPGISAFGQVFNNAGPINIGLVGSPASTVTVQGGTVDSPNIGTASLSTFDGAITVYSSGAMSVLGGSGTGSDGAYVEVDGTNRDLSLHVGSLAVTAGPAVLGATTEAFVGIYTSGTILVDTAGTVTVTGGSGQGDATAEIKNFSGNVNIGTVTPCASLTVTGGNMTTGGVSNGTASINTLSGDITAGSLGAVTVLGGSGTGTADAAIGSATVSNIAITSASLSVTGGSATGAASSSNADVMAGTGSITATCTGPIVVTGAGGGTAFNSSGSVSLTTGPISFSAAGITVQGGNALNDGDGRVETTTGNITLASTGTASVLGGSGAVPNNNGIVRTATGDIGISGTTLTVQGGTASGASALVSSTATGAVALTASTQLLVNGGTANAANADVNTMNGNITLTVPSASGLTLNSAPATRFGHAAIDILNDGTVTCTSSGPVVLNGGVGTDSLARISTQGTMGGPGGPLTFNPVASVTLTGGSGDQSQAEILALATGDITISTPSGAVTLLGGSSAIANGSDALIYAVAGNLTVTPGLGVSLTGGTTSTQEALFQTGTGNITVVTAANVDILGGSGASSDAAFRALTSGNIDIQCYDMNMFGGSGATALSEVDTLAGDITILCQHDLTMNQGVGAGSLANIATHGSDIFIHAIHSIVLVSGATIIVAVPAGAPGNLLGIAGVDVFLGPATIVQVQGIGTLTLVSDDLFPTPNGIGAGRFDYDSTSRIDAVGGGEIKLFTAIRPQDTFNALIFSNGVGYPFISGVLYLNTPEEQWYAYYNVQNNNYAAGTIGFRIFYKDFGGNAFTNGVVSLLASFNAPGGAVIPQEGVGYFENFLVEGRGLLQKYSLPRALYFEKVGRPGMPILVDPPVFIADAGVFEEEEGFVADGTDG